MKTALGTPCTPERGYAHRTRLGEPNGPIARGTCRYCGYQAEAHNGHPGDYYVPPTGYGKAGNPRHGKERWRAYRPVACPDCGLAVDGPRLETHRREMHGEAA